MILIFAAVAIDILIGDPYFYPHPVKFMGKFISYFEKQVRKLNLSQKGLRIAGVFLGVSLTLLTYFLVFFILKGAYHFSVFAGMLIEIIFLWNCLALGCLSKECNKLYISLSSGNLDLAREQIAMLVSRDTQELDFEGVSKAAVETAVENTSDGIIAPLFFMLLGGAPLAMAYKAVNTLDSMVGYQNEDYFYFGWFCAKLDDVVNFIPARLTGCCMVVWAFLTAKDYKNGIRIMLRDNKKSKSPNAGWPESAFAGIFGIELCGPSKYFGQIVQKETIGDKKRLIVPEDVKHSCGFMYGCVIILLVLGMVLLTL